MHYHIPVKIPVYNFITNHDDRQLKAAHKDSLNYNQVTKKKGLLKEIAAVFLPVLRDHGYSIAADFAYRLLCTNRACAKVLRGPV